MIKLSGLKLIDGDLKKKLFTGLGEKPPKIWLWWGLLDENEEYVGLLKLDPEKLENPPLPEELDELREEWELE